MSELTLAERMKRYEDINRNYLTRRIPVIIRIDGKAFHTFTRDFHKPFDEMLSAAMQNTMLYLCENIQGCTFGYTQSDEISLLLTDFKDINTDAWFGYNIQKMASVAASMATMVFNREFANRFWSYCESRGTESADYDEKYFIALEQAKEKGALFDARCFSLPKDEVCNYFIWRQRDCERNSISSIGRVYFSQNQLNGKSCQEIITLLSEKGIDYNSCPPEFKQGSACYKTVRPETLDLFSVIWCVDKDIPCFTQKRDFVENCIYDFKTTIS